MDTLTFISNVIQALAWPLTLLILILLLRTPITNLIPLIQRLRYKDLELEFGQRVEEAKVEAAQELPEAAEEPTPLGPEREAIVRLAEISPRAAVLEAWRRVELATLATAKIASGDNLPIKVKPFQAIRALEQNERIERSAINLLKELRSLRNEAAHAPQFALSQESALEYTALAENVVNYLRSIN